MQRLAGEMILPTKRVLQPAHPGQREPIFCSQLAPFMMHVLYAGPGRLGL